MKLNQFLKSMFYLTVICIYYILNMLTICFLSMMVITSIREIELRCFNVLNGNVLLKSFSDVFNSGKWKSTWISSRQEFRDLADRLPDFCLYSKADNTRKKYSGAFNRFCKWCLTFGISSLPASDYNVSLYFIHLSDNCTSGSTIDEAFYAISWAHRLSGFPDPCSSFLPTSIREGCHRSIGHQKSNKKEPISPDIIKNICMLYASDTCSLLDLRISCMCVLSFSGFLRFSELVSLKRSDIKFFDNYLTLFIQKSKTDRYKQGSTVYISATGLVTCPVAVTKRYLEKANIAACSDEFIFRSISYCKSSHSYVLRGHKCLSYTRAREILLSVLESIGLDRRNFGLHSLRAGGATAAANAGICDRLFKKHGRWRSDSAKDGYVKEDLQQNLLVTKGLGI